MNLSNVHCKCFSYIKYHKCFRMQYYINCGLDIFKLSTRACYHVNLSTQLEDNMVNNIEFILITFLLADVLMTNMNGFGLGLRLKTAELGLGLVYFKWTRTWTRLMPDLIQSLPL